MGRATGPAAPSHPGTTGRPAPRPRRSAREGGGRAGPAHHSTLIRPSIEKKPVKIGNAERWGGYGRTALVANASPPWKAETPGKDQVAATASSTSATGE